MFSPAEGYRTPAKTMSTLGESCSFSLADFRDTTGNRKARMRVGANLKFVWAVLSAKSRRSPPIPTFSDLPILVKASIESETVKNHGAA